MTSQSAEEIIKRNFEIVEEKIFRALDKCGRKRTDLKLIVVSKGQAIEKMMAAYKYGARFFGENYPEETVKKIAELSDWADIEWHMIGHLQSRKAKIVTDSFSMLHSLDSLHTAEKLERLLTENGRVLPVLIELNISGETSKNGILYSENGEPTALYDFIEKIMEYKHLRIDGLMTMPPLLEEPNEIRPYFCRLKIILESLKKRFPSNQWNDLSMGTSLDFEVAIEEGSTMIRVGSALLGERNYH